MTRRSAALEDVTDRRISQGRLDDLDLGAWRSSSACERGGRSATTRRIQAAQQTLDIAKKATIDAELRWTEGQPEIATALQEIGPRDGSGRE